MPIYFRKTPVHEPFTFDSIGNHWYQERVVRPKGFPLYHYLLSEKGQGYIEIQGRFYTLNEGEGVLIAPLISHSYNGLAKEWTTSFATITGTMETQIASMLGSRQIVFTRSEQAEEISRLIANGISLLSGTHPDVKALSINCYQLLMHFLDGLYTENITDEPLYQRYVAPVIKEIETHFAAKLTSEELSRTVFITPQYLSRLFRRFLGCSAYEYLTTYRINKAKELLLNNERMDVQHITHLVGFEDSSHFIAMFKKFTGVTPLEFRLLHKSDR